MSYRTYLYYSVGCFSVSLIHSQLKSQKISLYLSGIVTLQQLEFRLLVPQCESWTGLKDVSQYISTFLFIVYRHGETSAWVYKVLKEGV